MSEGRPRRRRGWRGPRRLHRFLGLLSALPLLWFCVSGLLLQHQEELGLPDRKVRSAWLLKRYNQIPDGEPRGVKAGRFFVAEWDGVLYLDDRILEQSGPLVGAVAKPAELVVATGVELFVYDAQGSFLDRLGEESLPTVPIARIGLDSEGRVVVEGSEGGRYRSGDLLDFEASGAEGVTWSAVSEAGERRKALEIALVEGAGFTWARVVTDLHSGRLFGGVGRILVDLSGIGLIVLTLSGICLLIKRT